MKKLILLLFIPLVFTCSDDSSDDNSNNVDDTNPVYLDANGVTIKARDWAVIGDSGEVDGVTYTIIDRETLIAMIENGDDLTRVCTSRIVNLESPWWGINDSDEFNQDISSWDVSNVTSMFFMFNHLESFNQDISAWDVGNVTDMTSMFYNASQFNQDLSSWNVDNVTSCNAFCAETVNWDFPKPNFTNCSDFLGCD